MSEFQKHPRLCLLGFLPPFWLAGGIIQTVLWALAGLYCLIVPSRGGFLSLRPTTSAHLEAGATIALWPWYWYQENSEAPAR